MDYLVGLTRDAPRFIIICAEENFTGTNLDNQVVTLNQNPYLPLLRVEKRVGSPLEWVPLAKDLDYTVGGTGESENKEITIKSKIPISPSDNIHIIYVPKRIKVDTELAVENLNIENVAITNIKPFSTAAGVQNFGLIDADRHLQVDILAAIPGTSGINVEKIGGTAQTGADWTPYIQKLSNILEKLDLTDHVSYEGDYVADVIIDLEAALGEKCRFIFLISDKDTKVYMDDDIEEETNPIKIFADAEHKISRLCSDILIKVDVATHLYILAMA